MCGVICTWAFLPLILQHHPSHNIMIMPTRLSLFDKRHCLEPIKGQLLFERLVQTLKQKIEDICIKGARYSCKQCYLPQCRINYPTQKPIYDIMCWNRGIYLVCLA